MAMFIVVATKGAAQVQTRIVALGVKHLRFKDDAWFVLFDGTPRELAERSGIRSGEAGTGIVAPITSYSGRASKEVWDWIEANWKAE